MQRATTTVLMAAFFFASALTAAATQPRQGDRDYQVGARLAERAAFASSKAEQLRLATEAVDHLRSAANAGHSEAQYRLGRVLASSMLGDADEQAALQWFLSAAEQGHVEAQVETALAYYHGKGSPIDRAAAARWFARASNRGDVFATNRLMLMVATGDGIPKDEAREIELLTKLAATGSPQFITALAEKLEWASEPLRKPQEVESWYRQAAKAGDGRAQYRLGLILERRGEFAAASELYEKSEKGRLGVGAYRLARMYEKGQGVPQDLELARKNYERAYKSLPSPVSYFAAEKLVYFYRNGLGGRADLALADKLQVWVEKGPAKFDDCKREWQSYGASGGRCEWVYESDLQ